MRDGGRKERGRERQTHEVPFSFLSQSPNALLHPELSSPSRAQDTIGGPPQSLSNPACSRDAQR